MDSQSSVVRNLESQLLKLREHASDTFQDVPALADVQLELTSWLELIGENEEEQKKQSEIQSDLQSLTAEFRQMAVNEYHIAVETKPPPAGMTPGKRNPLGMTNPFSQVDSSPFLPPSLGLLGSAQKKPPGKTVNWPDIQFADENARPSSRQAENKNPPGNPVSRCREIRSLDVDEFAQVPKYMKGSLTVDKLNAVVQKLNSAIGDKYDFLGRSTQKGGQRGLSKVDKDRLVVYRDQENKETRGFAFVCESDFKAQMNPREQLGLKQVLPILRHCGRLKEVRGQKLLRYLVLPH